MRIAVYGLGYVGSVTAACLADLGHQVTGLDIDPGKVDAITAGRAPVHEPELDDLIATGLGAGRLRADTADHIPSDVDVHVVCVGTPSNPNGSIDLRHVVAVSHQIGAALAAARSAAPDAARPTVVFRSTVLPGTVRSVLLPELEAASGLRAGVDFGLAMCPEFLRETTAVADFADPPMTVVGTIDEASGSAVLEMFRVDAADAEVVGLETAETIKYASNAFHAVKVAFANEIGRFARATGGDAQEAMAIFCQDRQLNISPAYLRPGFAFGGSCLPKDLRALVHRARSNDLDLPLLTSVLPSNERHLRSAVELVLDLDPRSVALFGLAFKTGTDDLRDSPFVHLAEALLGKGIDVRIWDPDLDPGRLIGRNLSFVEHHLPHLARLLHTSPASALEGADVCVVGTTDPSVTDLLADAAHPAVVDLVANRSLAPAGVEAVGVAW